MVDADNNSKDIWQSIRNFCLPSIPDFPENLPEIGLIHTINSGVKFGVWMMPDNKMSGMLETFLTYIIPDEKELLWNYAKTRAISFSTFPFYIFTRIPYCQL